MDPVYIYTITALIILFASLVRGATGFGLAMTAMPLLSLILPFREAVTLVVIINLLFSILHIFRSKGSIDSKAFILIIVFAIVGVTLGVLTLKFVNQNILKTFAGIVIILFSISYLKGFSLKLKNENIAYSLSALMGGILAGSASIGGPVAAIFLGGMKLRPAQFRYAMSVFFLISYLYATIMQQAIGLINMEILYLSLFSLPFLILGLITGDRIAQKIKPERLKRLVPVILAISGTLITYQGIISLL